MWFWQQSPARSSPVLKVRARFLLPFLLSATAAVLLPASVPRPAAVTPGDFLWDAFSFSKMSPAGG